MKEIKMFYINGCPYCANAKKAIEALKEENPAYREIPLAMINENEHPEISQNYDYYYVPTMILGEKKVYEAHPGESYAECLGHVKAVFDAALE